MKKQKRKKEEVAEDYCFICKDGGLLLVCEYKHCNKAYHPQCVEKDATFLETGERWTCSWHSCFICNRNPKFHCFCCPNAVCQRCIKVAEFVHIRGKKGFCNNCLKLALLIEENVDVDSDGGKVDFKDRETYEFLFKEYWEILKAKEGLTLEILHFADVQLKKGEKYRSGSDSDRFTRGEEKDQELISDFDEDMDDRMEKQMQYMYMDEPEGQQCVSMKKMKRKVRSKKREFIGWGSKPLVEFLASIGKDTSKELSQFEVNDIIKGYVHENNLTHPVKKKKILCDARLQSIFSRKSVNRNKIYDLLEGHFSENQEKSEDEFRCSSDDEDDVSKACKRQRKTSSGTSHKKGKVVETPRSFFASVTPKNIKLVYLKRSLVEDLLKNPETFEGKVRGSFVRVKSDPNDCFQRNSHQLLQVTGIKKALGTGDISTESLLQVSNMKKEVRICMLSDADFSEEECEDLQQRVKDGLLKKPTIEELDQKARILHEDITNHWIDRELSLLQNLIDRANEKGWRRELCEYLERRQLLQTPSEQLRLLQRVPVVIAEEIEPEATPQNSLIDAKQGKDFSPRSILVGTLENSTDDLSGNGITSTLTVGRTDATGDGAICYQKSEKRKSGVVGDSLDEITASEIAVSDLADDNGNGDVIKGSVAMKDAEGIEAAFMVSRHDETEEPHSNIFVSEESSVPAQGEQHYSSAYVGEKQYQPVELLESRETHLAYVAGKWKHQPIEAEKNQREMQLACVAEQQHHPIEVKEESNREMQLVCVAEWQHQPIEVEEEISRETQLACVAEQQHLPIDVEEESSLKIQLACVAEQQHQPLEVEEEISREMQFACVAEQKNHPMVVEQDNSRDTLLAFVIEHERQPIEVEKHTSNEENPVDLDGNGSWAMVDRQGVSGVQFINLSDDDEGPDDLKSPSGSRNQNLGDPDIAIWNYVDPFGDVQGPFSMSALKHWIEGNYFGPGFKVWKTGQSREEAILLTDAICGMFPKT